MATSTGSSSSGRDTPATSVAGLEILADEGEKIGPVYDVASIPAQQADARLQFIIQRSGIFSSIIGEQMARQTREKQDAALKAQLETQNQQERVGAPARSRSARSGANIPPKPESKKLVKRGKTTKQNRMAAEEAAKLTARALADTDGGEAKLGEQTNLKSVRQPRLITGGIMKDYQLEGLDWLVSLYENGLNGILADEMGLGKTLQTISFLAFLMEKGVAGPFLIACPVSTLHNWVSEIDRFAPDMPKVLYHGTPIEREKIRQKYMPDKPGEGFPVICTSYEIIMKDRKQLQRYQWKFIIIDEGHRIKNLNCKLVRELKAYNSANRLLLTGTPLQNNLAELWSLLNFLLPDIFDDLDTFNTWFDFSALQEKDGHQQFMKEERKNNLVGSLHQILKPFLLRRLKTDVETNLPPKREYILYAPLTQQQKDLYGKLLDGQAYAFLLDRMVNSEGSESKKRKLLDEARMMNKSPASKSVKVSVSAIPGSRDQRKRVQIASYEDASDDDISENEFISRLEKRIESQAKVNADVKLDVYEREFLQAVKAVGSKKLQNTLMQLRLTCNSPYLFYWPWARDQIPDNSLITESGKMMLLDRLVPELFIRGHKVLIFSQFSKMLDILENWASIRKWGACRIDGGIPHGERQVEIERFNNDPQAKMFLLSTRAGGLGINLTASDTVILFDSDYNPQADLQAQDRAHRIGQKKPVIVYRLATAGTVEQTLLDKADGKRRLEKLIIQKGKFKSFSKEQEEGASLGFLKEDFEKVPVMGKGQQMLTDEELETLLDRSPEAYKWEKGGVAGVKMGGAAFKAV